MNAAETRPNLHQRRLALQYEVARILAESSGMRRATQAVFKAICEHEGFVAASLWRVSDDAAFLQYVDFWTEEHPALVTFVAESLTLRLAPRTGLAGRAWATRHPVSITDIREVPDLPPPALKAGLRSGLVLPVTVQGEVKGLMGFWSFAPREETRESLEMFHALGCQLGQYIERNIQSAKVSRLSRLHAVLTAINRAITRATSRQQFLDDICRIAVDDGKFGAVWIGEYDSATMNVKPVACAGEDAQALVGTDIAPTNPDLPRGQSLIGRAVRTRESAYTNNLAAEPSTGGPRRLEALRRGYHSCLAMPLIERDAVTGTLSLFAKDADFFNADEVAVFKEVSKHVSMALENLPPGMMQAHTAGRDALTGAATLPLLAELMRQASAHASRDEQLVAIAVLKLENFAALYDGLTRQAVDALLKAVAARIHGCIRKTDTLARLSANEFALLLPLRSDAAMVSHVMHRLQSTVFDLRTVQALLQGVLDEVQRPLALGGATLQIVCGMGVSVYPRDGDELDKLLQSASLAATAAQVSGEDRFRFYHPEMEAQAGRSPA